MRIFMMLSRQAKIIINEKLITSILLSTIFATQGAIIGCFVCRDSELSTPLALFLPYTIPAHLFSIHL
jgi:hypothetical protein